MLRLGSEKTELRGKHNSDLVGDTNLYVCDDAERK
jgi:hypothetical protein